MCSHVQQLVVRLCTCISPCTGRDQVCVVETDMSRLNAPAVCITYLGLIFIVFYAAQLSVVREAFF